MRWHYPAVVAIWLASAPAFAHDDGARRLPDPLSQRAMQGTIQESDVSLFFDYLRAAIRAAGKGTEPPPPPRELEQRVGEIASELKAQGTLAALLLLSTLEKQAGALIREGVPPARPGALPPTVPYTAVSERH